MYKKFFIICIHDVTPCFEKELNVIMPLCQNLIGDRFSCAVVPNWHKEWPIAQYPRFIKVVASHARDILIHGYTHLNGGEPGIVSYLTQKADEYRDMPPEEWVNALIISKQILESVFERTIYGVTPPAWQCTQSQSSYLKKASLKYLVRFSRIESGKSGFYPLNTWSWDWGRWDWGGYPAEYLSRVLMYSRPSAPLQIVIHPRDISRSYIGRCVGMVQRLIKNNWVPICFEDLPFLGDQDEELDE